MAGKSVVTPHTETKALHHWLDHSKVVEEEDGPVLTLNGVREAGNGSCMCEVENQGRKIVSKPIHLQIGEWQSFILGEDR